MGTWSSPLTDTSLCLDLGTRLSVCGISPQGRRPVGSRITQRTSSPWPSPPITDKSFPQLVIKPSSCGTLWLSKYTIQEDGHQDWVSCVRFSPNNQNPIIVSAGWDKYVKVWNLTNCKLKTNHIGHTGYLNTVTMSPDGSLCASGGKDAKAMLWDLN